MGYQPSSLPDGSASVNKCAVCQQSDNVTDVGDNWACSSCVPSVQDPAGAVSERLLRMITTSMSSNAQTESQVSPLDDSRPANLIDFPPPSGAAQCCTQCAMPLSNTSEHSCVAALTHRIQSLQSQLHTLDTYYKKQFALVTERENVAIKHLAALHAQNVNYRKQIREMEIFVQKNQAANKTSSYDSWTLHLSRDQSGSLGFNVAAGSEASSFKGVMVTKITKNSPASRCNKIKVGDCIVSVNGISLRSLDPNECIETIKSSSDPVSLEVERPICNQKSMSTQTDSELTTRYLGRCSDLISLSSVTDLESIGWAADHEFADSFLASQQSPVQIQEVLVRDGKRSVGLFLRDAHNTSSAAVEISQVLAGSLAWEHGRFMAGDQISSINGTEISSVNQAAEILDNPYVSQLTFVLLRDVEMLYGNNSPSSEGDEAATLKCSPNYEIYENHLSSPEKVHQKCEELPYMAESHSSNGSEGKDRSSAEYESPRQVDSEHFNEQDGLVCSPRGDHFSKHNQEEEEAVYESIDYDNLDIQAEQLSKVSLHRSATLDGSPKKKKSSKMHRDSSFNDFRKTQTLRVPSSKSYHDFNRSSNLADSTLSRSMISIDEKLTDPLRVEVPKSKNSSSRWKVKIRSDGTRYVTRRKREDGEEEIHTTDEENFPVPGKYVPKSERKRQVQEPRKKTSTKPKLEPVKEDKEVTLSRRHHTKVRSKLLDYSSVQQIMNSKTAAFNPLISIVTV